MPFDPTSWAERTCPPFDGRGAAHDTIFTRELEHSDRLDLSSGKGDVAGHRAFPSATVHRHEHPSGVAGRDDELTDHLVVRREVRRDDIRPGGLAPTVVGPRSNKGAEAERDHHHDDGRGTEHADAPISARPKSCFRLESLHETGFEAERWLHSRRQLLHCFDDDRELFELGAARLTRCDMVQHVGPSLTGQPSQSKLRQVVGDRFTLRRVFDITAHVASLSNAPRSFAMPKRIRPFAVPSGIASARAISAALHPYMAANKTARR